MLTLQGKCSYAQGSRTPSREKVEELAKAGYEEGEFGLDTMGSDSPLISKVQGELVFNRRGPGQTSQVQYLKGSPKSNLRDIGQSSQAHLSKGSLEFILDGA